MQLTFQNSKDLKQARQFVKSFNYVYDSITTKQKQIFLYISQEYIALVNNFMDRGVNDYRVCFCKLKKSMYRLSHFKKMDEEDRDGYIFQLESDLIPKLMNSQVEPEITQLTMVFPDYEMTREMELCYEADGIKAKFKLQTRIDNNFWPFKYGLITEEYFDNSFITPFLIFPPKFVKQIEYAKKFEQLWICASPDVIHFKKTEGRHIVLDHQIKKQEVGEYDSVNLSESLNGNINFNVKTDMIFQHLELSNKQNRKTNAYLIVEKQYYEESSLIKKCYLYLTTDTQKRQIHQFYQVLATQQLQFLSQSRPPQTNRMNRPILKDMKKQEQIDEERVFLNRFYGPEYEDAARQDTMHREGVVKQAEPNYEESMATKPRKYKLEV